MAVKGRIVLPSTQAPGSPVPQARSESRHPFPSPLCVVFNYTAGSKRGSQFIDPCFSRRRENVVYLQEREIFSGTLRDTPAPSVADCKIRKLSPSWATMGSHGAFLHSPQLQGTWKQPQGQTFFPHSRFYGQGGLPLLPCIFYAKLQKK